MRVALIFTILIFLLLEPNYAYKALAEEEVYSLTKEVNYDIAVQLSDKMISKIKNVRVLGITKIGDKEFLIVIPQIGIKIANCLIVLDSIKTIIPSNASYETIIP